MSLSVHIKKKLKNYMLEVELEAEKSCLGLLGASGCGKSMTLKCIAGIEKPDEGRILLNDKVLFDSGKGINLRPQKRKVGYLFQNYALFPRMSVRKNIEMGLSVSGSLKSKEADRLLKQFHLEEVADACPGMISGGQQQRAALARMLAAAPEVLLLDEPFSALDSYLKEYMIQEMKDFLEDYQKTVILVSHSREEIYQMCGKMAVMDQGKIEAMGETAKLFANPRTLQAAKITGCKNLSAAHWIGEHIIYAEDWGINLYVKEKVSREVTHVGIRAHDLVPVYRIPLDNNTKKLQNVMFCKKIRMVEAPFEHYIILENTVPKKRELSPLWWKVPNQIWEQTEKKIPEAIHFPREKIILLHK